MFYIDFTSPEGKTYRIDVSKNPVIYECPICGGKTIYEFDPTQEDCCRFCVERRQEEEQRTRKKRSDRMLVARINKHCGSDITVESLHKLYELIQDKYFTSQQQIEFFTGYFRDLKKANEKKKLTDRLSKISKNQSPKL